VLVLLLQISQSRQGHLAQKRSERLEAERVSHTGLALLWLLCFVVTNLGSGSIPQAFAAAACAL
jgi:hypothetical protein